MRRKMLIFVLILKKCILVPVNELHVHHLQFISSWNFYTKIIKEKIKINNAAVYCNVKCLHIHCFFIDKICSLISLYKDYNIRSLNKKNIYLCIYVYLSRHITITIFAFHFVIVIFIYEQIFVSKQQKSLKKQQCHQLFPSFSFHNVVE